MDPISAGPQILEAIVAADEPVDPIRFELDDNVFLHPRPFVVGLLAVQVMMTGRAGDLDEQFGRST